MRFTQQLLWNFLCFSLSNYFAFSHYWNDSLDVQISSPPKLKWWFMHKWSKPLYLCTWIYDFEEGDIILTSLLMEPITAICLAVNHPSCFNSFCVLSQSAFRPHTHISITFKVRCTSLHFIPPSLSIHPSLNFSTSLHRETSSSSPLGCWFSCKSCDFFSLHPNFCTCTLYLLTKASF